ncbi:MAG: tetratricopeptide repeat protein [Chloroflexi bacterium]|nr:tetratricopeptide repeat protein [Chloroflexota bacterium]
MIAVRKKRHAFSRSTAIGIILLALAFGNHSLLGELFANLGFVHLARVALLTQRVPGANAALTAFNSAVKFDPNRAAAYRGYGRLLLQQADFEGAIDNLMEAQALNSHRDQITAWQTGNAFAAVGQLDRAIGEWRDAESAPYFLAEGKENLHKGSDYCPQAEKPLRLATLIDPLLAEAHYDLGQSLQCLDRNEQAKEAYERAADLFDERSPWQYLARGHFLRIEGLWDEAASAFQASIAREQRDVEAGAEARLALSDVLSRNKGDVKGAVRLMEELAALKPRTEFLIRIGDIYQENHGYAEAREWYQRAKRLDPNSAEADRQIIKTYVAEGFELSDNHKVDDAERIFRSTVNLYPRSAYAHSALGWFMYQVRRDAGQAVAELNQAIEIDPSDSSSYTRLGYVYLQGGDLAKATEVLQTGLDRNPRDAAAHAFLGMAYSRQGSQASAINELDQALAIAPKRAMYYEILGDAYRKAGQVPEAIASFRKALDLEPGRDYSRQQLQKLSGSAER